jgi:hypothetical protein
LCGRTGVHATTVCTLLPPHSFLSRSTLATLFFYDPNVKCFLITRCFRPSGISFKVTQNFEAGYIPKTGDIVTFEHDAFSRRDVPINPKIVRIRKDMNWENVVYDYRQSMRGMHFYFHKKYNLHTNNLLKYNNDSLLWLFIFCERGTKAKPLMRYTCVHKKKKKLIYKSIKVAQNRPVLGPNFLFGNVTHKNFPLT